VHQAAGVGGADVHARALADRLEPLEDEQVLGVVGVVDGSDLCARRWSVTEPVIRIYLPGRSANPRRATCRITTGRLDGCAELSRRGTSKVSWWVSLRIYQVGSTLFIKDV
jgi:hypothetical protein